MHYVIDQNYFRTPDFASRVNTNIDDCFVIPDVALVEMTKSDQWHSTMRSTLRPLIGHESFIKLSCSIGEVLAKEYSTKQIGTFEDVIPDDIQAAVPKLLEIIHLLDGSIELNEAANSINTIRDEIQLETFDHLQNATSLRKLVNSIRREISNDFLRRLKNNNATREDRLSKIREIAINETRIYLLNHGFTEDATVHFIIGKSCYFRYFCLKIRHALDWLIRNGIDNAIPERLTNDVIDQEYILSATYCDGILSLENRVNTGFQEMCEILELPAA